MRHLKFPLIIIAYSLLAVACKKHDDPPQPSPGPVPVTADTGFKCADLPPGPDPWGWSDSTYDENQNVNAFARNPLNGEELLIVVNGDAFGYNKLIAYNPRTKQAKQLAILDEYLPDVNARGWIVFSTNEKNVYRIKANGDSLTQLTSMHINYDAKWDRTGQAIYYFQDAYLQTASQLVKVRTNGTALGASTADIPWSAPFRTSDQIIYQRVTNNVVTLVQRSSTGVETTLINGTYDRQKKQSSFQNLTMNHDDTYFYWSNSGGIFRCRLGGTKPDTVYRNCENSTNMRPMMSRIAHEMTFTRHLIRPISKFVLLHEYKSFEYDFDVGVLREVRVFQ